MTRTSSNRLWIWFGLVAVLAIIGQRITSVPLVQYAAYMGIDLAALAAVVVGLRINRPANPLAWKFLLANSVVFFMADAVFYTRHDILHLTEFPTPADPIYLAHYGLLFAGLLLLVKRRSSGRPDRAAAIDATVAGIGAALVAWLVWVGPSLAGHMPLLTRLDIAVYPVVDVALFAISLRLLAGRGTRPTAFWLLNAAVLSLFVADSLLGWQQSRGAYITHNYVDALWLGFIVLVGMSALHPSMREMDQPVEASRNTSLRTIALGISAAVPPIALLLGNFNDRSERIAIAAATLAMYSLVIVRLHMAGADERRARKSLEVQGIELADTVQLLELATDARSQLLDGIVTAAEKERGWVAAELHDGPIQILSAIGFGMDRTFRRLASSDIDGAREALDQQREELTNVIASLRRLMADLRPPALDESGLDGAIRDYIATFSRLSGIACTAELEMDGARLDTKTETIVYRVIQEALTNIRKHSFATSCHVMIRPTAGAVTLEVNDNGHGFDAALQSQFVAEQHFGLSTMRERVEVAGGQWKLNSSSNGTAIRAVLPVGVLHLALAAS